MKNYVFLIIIFSLIFLLTSCGQVYVCPNGERVSNIEDCKEYADVQNIVNKLNDSLKDLNEMNINEDLNNVVNELDENNNIQEEQNSEVLNNEDNNNKDNNIFLENPDKELINNYINKLNRVKNYKFNYYSMPGNKIKATYFVYGSKIKIVLPEKITYEGHKIDTLFYDLDTKKTEAYCYDALCKEEGPFSFSNIKDYLIIFPENLIKMFNQAESLGIVQSKGYTVDRLKVIYNNKYCLMPVHTYYGIPIELICYDNPDFEGEGEGFEYRDLGINGLKKEDVMPKTY